MATVLPNMSLKAWNAEIDNFSHAELAQNFVNIDNHDHTSGKGVQVGPGGVANLSIGTAQIADNSVISGKISSSAPITDDKLSSPNNSVYKTIFRSKGIATSANNGTSPFFLGSPLVPASTTTTSAIDLFYLAVADYTVANKTPFLQIGLVAFTNNTVPGVSFTAGLNLVSVNTANATNNNQAYVAGSQIANSQALIAAPAPNTQNEQASIDFAFPADGYYAICVNMGGTPGVGSYTMLNATLRIRHT